VDQPERKGRLRFAAALRGSADNYLSEQALRDALSRSYYSVFHLGCTLLGKGYGNQKEFLKDLREKVGDDELSKNVESLQEWRITADYMFDVVVRKYGGDPEGFRNAASEALKLGQQV
jgi:uncharacterized protein (UPF0332 family)